MFTQKPRSVQPGFSIGLPGATRAPRCPVTVSDASSVQPMRRALELAAEGLGRVWPNPSVGCVIVRDGQVVGEGRTADGGRPHAEPVALEQAGSRARGATVYVTLEPCSHWGRTPPCSDALVEARVGRVIMAVRDPDPRVDGKGRAQLADAGISVEVGMLEAEAEEVNAGFFHRLRHGRPLVGVTAAHGNALRAVSQRWDAVMAHPAFAVATQPAVAMAFDDLKSVIDEGRWHLHHGEGPLSVPRGRQRRGTLRAALAALGELGLTRLLLHADDPLAAYLREVGLVDRDL